jgi:hypothetical protein
MEVASAGHAAPLLKLVGLISKHFSGKEKQERAQALMDALRIDYKFLEADFNKLNVKVEDLAEALQQAVYQDIQSFNDSKRERYLKILGNAVRSEVEIQDLASFIRDVEQLGDGDVAVLKVLNKTMNQAGDWSNQAGPVSLWKVHPNTFIQRRQEMAIQIAQALGMGTEVDVASGPRFNPEIRILGVRTTAGIWLGARDTAVSAGSADR